MIASNKRRGQVAIGTAITVGLAIIGWLFVQVNRVSDKADAANSSVIQVKSEMTAQISSVKEDTSAMKTDINWIKETLQKKLK